ncbi:MAG: hypothetical protein HW421_387 [Ignavibacteria bacterium]|nr:hypothetical protein [Ignavibacteria bacterium]
MGFKKNKKSELSQEELLTQGKTPLVSRGTLDSRNESPLSQEELLTQGKETLSQGKTPLVSRGTLDTKLKHCKKPGFARELIKFFVVLSISMFALLSAYSLVSAFIGNILTDSFNSYSKKYYNTPFPNLNRMNTHFNNDSLVIAIQKYVVREKKLLDFNYPEIKVNIRTNYYFTLVLLISLIISSPVTFRRKLFACISGIILFNLFFAFKISIEIATLLNQTIVFDVIKNNAYLVYESSFYKDFINVLNSIFNELVIGSRFPVAIVLWFLLTFRAEEYSEIAKMLEKPISSEKKSK